MTKLRLGPFADDKPIKISIELAAVHRGFVVYAQVLGRTTGQTTLDPANRIVPMVEQYIASDCGSRKVRHAD